MLSKIANLPLVLSLILTVSISFASAQELRIMTYNIRFDNPGDGVNAWPNRKSKVFQLIRKYDPDVIGVQEALKHQLDDIQKELPEYVSVGVGRDDGKEKGEYSAILYKKSKLRADDINTMWLSETPDVSGSKSWDAAITRLVTTGKFIDLQSGKTVYILNTHFDHVGKEARKNSASLIKEKAGSLGNEPLILTGDFNCTREEEPYKVIINNNDPQLYDPAPENAPGTFCTFVKDSIACRAIDYIFHSAHWNASSYQVITDNDGKHFPSDHLPVMVTLTMRKN